MLVADSHHHLLRALWFALIYLTIAYGQSKRGLAVRYLLDRVVEEWRNREEKAKKPGGSAWGFDEIGEREGEWMQRARRVMRGLDQVDGRWMGSVWAEMKGMCKVEEVRKINLIQEEPPKPPADLEVMTGLDGGAGLVRKLSDSSDSSDARKKARIEIDDVSGTGELGAGADREVGRPGPATAAVRSGTM